MGKTNPGMGTILQASEDPSRRQDEFASRIVGVIAMNPDYVCRSIRESLPDLFECSAISRHSVRIRTPLMYPDGGIVDVFVLEEDGQCKVTDFGEALGWLRMQSVSGRRSIKQNQMVDDTCQTLGVKIVRGQLVLRLLSDDQIGEAILRLAQAVVRVSDLWFTLRSRPIETAAKEINHWLKLVFDSRQIKSIGNQRVNRRSKSLSLHTGVRRGSRR